MTADGVGVVSWWLVANEVCRLAALCRGLKDISLTGVTDVVLTLTSSLGNLRVISVNAADMPPTWYDNSIGRLDPEYRAHRAASKVSAWLTIARKSFSTIPTGRLSST